ncbi:organic hydroperoxide resistance protein [Allonocardiopsis opalescens]|uniref:Ohr subfamily peroxiredoxin n=1 Tax=Allonocardiopsis opalescens TaxID=1144618 RepID=A0A2T0Q0V7_9ACTN|nr:organic hydroperoxide resistance protein [Allonocardiopsis opalescens]PRX97414.1 Ohr subfamily peroxiredoxin [Allonocardiopsis opalescens]
MTVQLTKDLYTAEVSVQGGRQNGHAVSADKTFDVRITPPTDMGGSGEGTNPEELFAAGYAACFQGALGVVARRQKVDTGESTVTAKVTLGSIDGGGFGLKVALEVAIPGVDSDTVQQLIEAAHQVCPYSNATRGNIEVDLRAV